MKKLILFACTLFFTSDVLFAQVTPTDVKKKEPLESHTKEETRKGTSKPEVKKVTGKKQKYSHVKPVDKKAKPAPSVTQGNVK
ncbi:MAG: hypothetical protein NT126_10565 [Bacteroidetes bacterium]|nr:hypothetical protein [Bacteroidota bacterium]